MCTYEARVASDASDVKCASKVSEAHDASDISYLDDVSVADGTIGASAADGAMVRITGARDPEGASAASRANRYRWCE
ncbi:hypothetical protein HII30_13060 [Paenibacillus lemnae]|uniref:Uncharacterized protein n=1 Tax=Paenibacillus lemnae TaxID=1330551 RepID=A0A848M9F1_PAELE|nr:hypothetical protein [Paenibacillus lemnae]